MNIIEKETRYKWHKEREGKWHKSQARYYKRVANKVFSFEDIIFRTLKLNLPLFIATKTSYNIFFSKIAS